MIEREESLSPAETRTFSLRSAQFRLVWSLADDRLRLARIRLGEFDFLRPNFEDALKAGERWPCQSYLTDAGLDADPILVPEEAIERDASESGNPLLLTILEGADEGDMFAMRDFQAEILDAQEKSLQARLVQRRAGLTLELRAEMKDGVSLWTLTATSDAERVIEIVFPFFARIRAGSPATDRAYVSHASGCVLKNLMEADYDSSREDSPGAPYRGDGIDSPFLIFQGEDKGLYLIDESVLANEKAALSERALIVGSRKFLARSSEDAPNADPAIGVRHRMRLTPSIPFALGPAILGAHKGGWKTAGMMIRHRLRGRIAPTPIPENLREESVLFEREREIPSGDLVAHSHEWTRGRFEAPVMRFILPERRVFESAGDDPARAVKSHLLNFTMGQSIFIPRSSDDFMIALARRSKALHAAYSEIPFGEMIPEEVRADHPAIVAHAFGSPMRMVIALANLSDEPVQAALWVPGAGSVLYDRMKEGDIPLAGGLAWLDLPGSSQFAYELR